VTVPGGGLLWTLLLSSAIAPARARAGTPAPAPAPATARLASAPNFAGRWRLDLARSEFGKSRRVPVSREDVIVLDGRWLSVKSVTVRAGDDTLRMEYRYRTNGDAVNTIMGQTVKTRGHRAGGRQHFDSGAKLLMISVLVAEHWTLSADGQTLTIVRESRSPLGNEKQVLCFTRQ